MYLFIRPIVATNHDLFLFRPWHYIFGLRAFQICFKLFCTKIVEVGIEILLLTITRKKILQKVAASQER